MKIQIITVDLKQLRDHINAYKIQHGYAPVLLMNDYTQELIKAQFKNGICIIQPSEEREYYGFTCPTLYGCHIAMAEWLKKGEVDIR